VSERDQLYIDNGLPGDFVFDDTVAQVFPDMIRRSVPGYAAIIHMIELLTARHAQRGTRLYDLGCSLGASTVALARGVEQRECSIIGIDNAPAMLARAESSWREHFPMIEWRCADLRQADIESASVVVMNFTLQFLPVDDRLSLLQRICDGLLPGGVLVLSEKIAGHDRQADELLTSLHHDFKRLNGYSELEISRKRTALENVLIPETLDEHRNRLAEAGFSRTDLWFQCFNFVSLVAVR
jgi:tRNA (cmo5U34)-methyltransferase